MDLHVRTGSAVHSPRVPGGGGDGVTPVVGGISSAGPARGPRVRRLDGAGTRGVWARLRRRLRLQWFTVVVVVLGCAAVGLLGWQLAHFPYSRLGPTLVKWAAASQAAPHRPGLGTSGRGAGHAGAEVTYDSMRDEMVRSKVVFEGSAVSTAVKLGKTRFSSRVPLAGAGSGTPSNTAAAGSSGGCRNTVQGRDVLTDEHGFQCSRHMLIADGAKAGCCPPQASTGVPQFSCVGCDRRFNCCTTFETCVSCCVNPANAALHEAMVAAGGDRHLVYASVSDPFDLCLFKCRTGSGSVVHENTYRSRDHFCFGGVCPRLSTDSFRHYSHTEFGDVRVEERPNYSPSLDAALTREYVPDPYLDAEGANLVPVGASKATMDLHMKGGVSADPDSGAGGQPP